MKVSHDAACPNTAYESFVSGGDYTFPATERLRNGGVDDVTLYLCIADKDNTQSVLAQKVHIDIFGNGGALAFDVPSELDRRTPQCPSRLRRRGSGRQA